MKTLRAFFKRKETVIGIGAALAFQLIFFTIWLTAYDGILNRTDQFKVAIVNDDKTIGEQVTGKILSNENIGAERVLQLKKAEDDLNERKWNMVIHIPKNFSSNLTQGKTANLEYLINQAAPTISRQAMESVASQLTKSVNDQVEKQFQEKAKKSIVEKAGSTNPAFAKIAEDSITHYDQVASAEPVQMQLKKTNNVEGFAASIIPLLIVLASFVGAMVMSMQLHFASLALQGQFSRWSIFGTRIFINAIVSVTLSILTMILTALFGFELQLGVISVWAFQSLLFFSFLSFAQTSLILFGNAGIIINIAAMALQLVSSGAMVPRELLNDFYYKIGNLLPATYGASGYFSTVFGGKISSDFSALLLLTCILIAISSVVSLWQNKQKPVTHKERESA